MDTYSEKVYLVTRFYISASDYHSNAHSDCEVFSEKDEATNLFRIWREEELELRKETGCAYEIYKDTEEIFNCSWDSDLEMMVLTLQKKEIKR
ncbi:MAG: hypothetical protein J6T38_02225 [Bacteroidaceae bacterium]|nr:hypothetical protein [Bacteroidaceae bacterium]